MSGNDDNKLVDSNFKLNLEMLSLSVMRALRSANKKPSDIKLVSANIVRSILAGKANPTIQTLSLIESECNTAILDFLVFEARVLPSAVVDTIATLETVLIVLEHLMTQGTITDEDQSNISPLLVKARMMLLTNNLSFTSQEQYTPPNESAGSNAADNLESVPQIRANTDPEEGTFFIQHS